MTAPILICLLMLAAAPAQAEREKEKSAFDKFIHSLFAPKHPKLTRCRQRVTSPQKRKKMPNICVVDREWVNHYWELEATWDYYIPEDDQITIKRGKYTVPIVVFRHYEDMKNSER